MVISAMDLEFRELNDKIRTTDEQIEINDCYGQRFICSGMKDKKVTINGTPGNALCSYLDGGNIVVNGNVQDAVGDTMNDGTIVVHGSAGDALGYAMRGGKIFVKGDAGYRTGIHMKEYKDKKPVIVIGGKVGSFLGEYLAGGIIIVLGLDSDEVPVGNFVGTGMHGGKMFIRTNKELKNLPAQVCEKIATEEDMNEIKEYIQQFAEYFGIDLDSILRDNFYLLTPNAKNPYKQLYTTN